MRHGIDGYFLEITRFQRRLSGIGAAVAVAFLALFLFARRPEVVAMLDDPKRFGFEGPDRYVERILLEAQGEKEQIGANTVNVVPVSLRAGGGKEPSKREGFEPAPLGEAHKGLGEGSDEFTLEARLRALALEGPIVQSEDLVVEQLVRPEYPEEARAENLEGVVELVALVDTTGSVLQVEIIGGSRNPLFDQAATSAVLQCRYRPYRFRQTVERVWAYFRITFRLY